MKDAGQPIVVFDAMCVLCSANAQWILRHDRRARFRLASVQSERGQELYRRFGLDPAEPETMILADGDRLLRDSDAVLVVVTAMGGPWRAARLFRAVPRGARDRLYRLVARNRYRLFGKRKSCWVPDAAHADRLL